MCSHFPALVKNGIEIVYARLGDSEGFRPRISASIAKYLSDNKLNVQGSVHTKYIPFDIFPTRCNVTQFIYFRKTALHLSGGISTHHQKHTQLYLQYLVLVKPLLLPAAIAAGSLMKDAVSRPYYIISSSRMIN
jgi:hypothetical protein